MRTPRNRKKLVNILVSPPWGSLFFHNLMIFTSFFPLKIRRLCFFSFTFCPRIALFSNCYTHPTYMRKEIQSPKEEHHWRLGKYIWAGRFANYYAVCTSLPSQNCSFAIKFSWVFNFLRDIPSSTSSHCHNPLKKKITFLPAKNHTACFPIPESSSVENRRSWDLPGNTKTIKSSIKTWNSNELSRLLSQAIFLPESSQVGSQAQPCPARRSEGYQFWT